MFLSYGLFSPASLQMVSVLKKFLRTQLLSSFAAVVDEVQFIPLPKYTKDPILNLALDHSNLSVGFYRKQA